MLSCFAACTAVIPASTRFCRAKTVFGSRGGLPGFLPFILAAWIPSFVRSEIKRRSKWAMALNMVIAAIVFWNTLYMDKAAAHLVRQGRIPDTKLFRHASPLGWEHIILAGDYDWHSGAAERKIARPLYLNTARKWVV